MFIGTKVPANKEEGRLVYGRSSVSILYSKFILTGSLKSKQDNNSREEGKWFACEEVSVRALRLWMCTGGALHSAC